MILIFGVTFIMAFLISLILFNGLKLKGMSAMQRYISSSKREKLMKAIGLIFFLLVLWGLFRIVGLNFYSGIILGVIGGSLSNIFKKDNKVKSSI